MKSWHVRAARSEDLPALTGLLPDWEAESTAALDDDAADPLLLACPLDAAGAAAPPVACLRLRRRIGLTLPRYWFHLGVRVHAAPELGMFRRERTLLLGNDHTGAAELADFGLDLNQLSVAERPALARLLVRAALLLLLRDHATHAQPDAQARVIASLPGRRDDAGRAPFWEGLGQHFYPGNVVQASARFGHLWRTHVAALLPRHPLVVSVLHEDAQSAVGAVNAAFEPWRAALAACGLRPGQHVDLYDAGPVYEAHLDLLSSHASIGPQRLTTRVTLDSPRPFLIAAASGDEVWQLPGQADAHERVQLSQAAAQALDWITSQPAWVSQG